MMPRLIRRRPWLERVKARLNVLDIILWISEGLESGDWDQWQADWGTLFGIVINIIFLVARANSGSVNRQPQSDVFGDDRTTSSGLAAWLVKAPPLTFSYTIRSNVRQGAFIVHSLSLLSMGNAIYTFRRKRYYRLFESSIDTVPNTPSASRVRVDSLPISSSPLRFLSKMLAPEQAESRSHPDAARDVWEISVWNPASLSLQLFCLFSPGHVVVYWLFLPTTMMDARPSTTIVTTIILGGLLSAQLMILQSSFTQQSKDTLVLHKEVLNEYDTKFVHPRIQPIMRDVGIQCSNCGEAERGEINTVETYRPAVIINRRFDVRPNPNYAQHLDHSGTMSQASPSRNYGMSRELSLETPTSVYNPSSSSHPVPAVQQLHRRPSLGVKSSDGGNLGIYSHANSPLRKARSTNFADIHHERSSSPAKREGSPLKQSSLAPGLQHGQRAGHPNHSTSSAARKERIQIK